MKRFQKKKLPLLFFFIFSALCALLFLAFRISPFAEWFSRYPAAGVRFLLGAITSLFPFSLFELLIGFFCLWGLFLSGFAVFLLFRRLMKKAMPALAWKPFFAFLLVAVTVFDLFVWTLAPSYYRFSTAKNMNLDPAAMTNEDMFYALDRLLAVVNESAEHLTTGEEGESLPSYNEKEIKRNVTKAANEFGTRNSFYQKQGFSAKDFLSSPLMTYTHLSGVYGFFTGEANVNTNYPHFIVTATLAHEACHARGIGAENECNFLASVILMESEDAYLRYCGAAFLADDFISLCKKIDLNRTKELVSKTAPVLMADFAAYSRFFEPYRDSTASKVADKTNSAYLKAMGQKEGTVSYSRIHRLTSAYFAAKALEK